MRSRIAFVFTTLFLQFSTSVALADDAYLRTDGNTWTFGTSTVERVVALENGKLLLKSFKNKTTKRELAPGGMASDEFFVRLGDAKQPLTGATGPWKLVRANQTRLKQGELQLELVLRQGPLLVTKTYVVYSGSSIIREWVKFANSGKEPLRLVEPGFLSLATRPGKPSALDFHWMTGGENQPGSWVLKTEKLSTSKPRTFDSYEPFPSTGPMFPGDGINAKIMLNDKQVWPGKGWQYVANATVTVPFEFNTDVAAGDKLVFLVNMNGNIGWDTTAFDPTITYADGEKHVASKEFGEKQGNGPTNPPAQGVAQEQSRSGEGR